MARGEKIFGFPAGRAALTVLAGALLLAPGCGRETFDLARRQPSSDADAGADRDGDTGAHVEACVESGTCSGVRPLCIQSKGRCGECEVATESTSCPAPFRRCDPISNECVACVEDQDCKTGLPPQVAAFLKCDAPTHRCAVGCTGDSDCLVPGLFGYGLCANGSCRQCAVDADCRRGTTCYEGACVECLVDADCPEDEQCSRFACSRSR